MVMPWCRLLLAAKQLPLRRFDVEVDVVVYVLLAPLCVAPWERHPMPQMSNVEPPSPPISVNKPVGDTSQEIRET